MSGPLCDVVVSLGVLGWALGLAMGYALGAA